MLGFGALGEFALGEGPSPAAFVPGGAISIPAQGARGLPPSAHPSFFYQPLTPDIKIDWFVALSEPYLVPKRLPPAYNPAFFYHPTPIIQISWVQPPSEPQRFPKRLDPASNPAFVRGTAPFYTPTSRGYVIC